MKVWLLLSAFIFALSVVHIAFFPDRDSLLVLLATSVYLAVFGRRYLDQRRARSTTG